MKVNFIKVTTILIYLIAIAALSSIIFGFTSNYKIKSVGNSGIENVVLKIYDYIDRGNYEGLSSLSIEGKWTDKGECGKPKYYEFNGLVRKDDFIENSIKDYGVNGWRLNFSSLSLLNINKISSSEFARKFPRESKILEYIKKENNVKIIYIIDLEGYIIGSCAIADWKKELPLLWTDQGWKAIITGLPEDLIVLHREQWLTNINFRIDEG